MLSKAVETGLSDFHKMVTTFMRNTYSHQEPIKTDKFVWFWAVSENFGLLQWHRIFGGSPHVA